MPNVTVCPHCGRLYEAASEEAANEPDNGTIPGARWCRQCVAEWARWGRVTDLT